jgi:hypothetical protein
MLLAWFATVMMLCFREESVSDSKSAPSKAGPVSGEIESHPENPTQ